MCLLKNLILIRECRGFAFVKYFEVADATEAVEALDNKELKGRRMKVQKSKRGKAHEKTPGEYLGHYKSRHSRRSPSPYR
jgi:RNA-binding proteins (RRM domain)